MKILAFAGSNSKNSINKQLATYAAKQFTGSEVEVIDLNDFPLPLFSVDVEKEIGFPDAAGAFLKKIEDCDFIVLSLAENNSSYNVGFKNIFDWASRKDKLIFQSKPMLLMATSTGARGGANVLERALKAFPRYGVEIKASFSLPSFNTNFDKEKGIISEELKAKLLEIIKSI